MLVLSRRPREKILIGEEIVVTVVQIHPDKVRLGIECPSRMNVVRAEIARERIAASRGDLAPGG